ncbi:hypothetical protein ABC304_07735 [Microbacterium sp. 1P10UB]|uniref:hypothetical protein n=1 Tax=unclassified Microbacterium TaxID=2609290 RepID=UPI0039A1980C
MVASAKKSGQWIGQVQSKCLKSKDELPDEGELVDAVSRGWGVYLDGFWNRDIDLGFLDPVIESLTFLKLRHVGPVVGTEILERASSLKALQFWGARVRGRDVGATFPALEAYWGPVTAAVAGISRSEKLQWMYVDGPIHAKAARFEGPVKAFFHEGSLKQVLPEFAQPEALESLCRSGVQEFDARVLLSFTHLRVLNVAMCRDLQNLDALGQLRNLERVVLNACAASGRGWSSIPDGIPDVRIWEPRSPAAGRQWLDDANARGWDVRELEHLFDRAKTSRPVFHVAEPAEEDAPWEVVSQQFDWLDDSFPDGASGHDVEKVFRRLLKTDPNWDYDTAVFDGEGDQFIVQLPTRALADRFVEQATQFITSRRESTTHN